MTPIPDILEDLRQGRMVILMDRPDRENEGDLLCAAEKITADIVNFMATECRGWICLTMTDAKAERLRLPRMLTENEGNACPAFTVTFEAKHGIGSGISMSDRATSILTAARDDCRPEDLVRPGHVQGIRAREGGVLVREGQTEGSVDLCRLAGLRPMGVICEVLRPDGDAARLPDLELFARHHDVRICTVDDLIAYRRSTEKQTAR